MSVAKVIEIISSSEKGARDYENYQFQELHTYRFVRFLPNALNYEIVRESQRDQLNKMLLFNPNASTEVEYILNP